MSTVVIFVNNTEHPSSVITMNFLQNFYTPIQIFNYKILYLTYWFIGRSEITLQNDKVKVVNNCVKNMDMKNCGTKVVGSTRFFLSKYLLNNWNTIVLKGVRIKPPKEINYVLFECNYFPKTPRKMKGCINYKNNSLTVNK